MNQYSQLTDAVLEAATLLPVIPSDLAPRLDALKNGHLGLVSARERAAAVGCELRVERPAEGGTCVSIRPRD